MMTPAAKLYTSSEVAVRLGITAGRVLRLAKSRNLGHRFGRVWAFTERDITHMQERVPGRPSGEKA